MVAASPIHYQDDQSSGAANTPLSGGGGGGGPGPGPGGGAGAGSASGGSVPDPDSPQQQQQQQQTQQQSRPAAATVHSPQTTQSNQPVDIHAYQPPWKGLLEYAQQAPGTPQQPDRLNSSSPRYQQLIGQVSVGVVVLLRDEVYHL
jgi:hypothetical protein